MACFASLAGSGGFTQEIKYMDLFTWIEGKEGGGEVVRGLVRFPTSSIVKKSNAFNQAPWCGSGWVSVFLLFVVVGVGWVVRRRLECTACGGGYM